jgi:hypothetical protein
VRVQGRTPMHIHGNDDNLRLAGKRGVSGEWRFLRCGLLTAYFDPETAALRRVCLGETELVRAVYVAVRDHNWNTIAPQLADVDLTEHDAGFHLTFSVRHRERDIFQPFWKQNVLTLKAIQEQVRDITQS